MENIKLSKEETKKLREESRRLIKEEAIKRRLERESKENEWAQKIFGTVFKREPEVFNITSKYLLAFPNDNVWSSYIRTLPEVLAFQYGFRAAYEIIWSKMEDENINDDTICNILEGKDISVVIKLNENMKPEYIVTEVSHPPSNTNELGSVTVQISNDFDMECETKFRWEEIEEIEE
jgi:hypothetical protein